MTALSSAGFAAATSGAEASRRGVLRGAIIGLGNVALHGHLPGWLSRRALVELAGRADRVLHTVHNWHHAPIVRQTRALVADGAIGRVTDAAWQTLRTRPAAVADGGADNWRVDPDIAGGGVLTDHGWHVCYILHRWI